MLVLSSVERGLRSILLLDRLVELVLCAVCGLPPRLINGNHGQIIHMTYLDRVEVRFLGFFEVAYRMVQVFLVDVCVAGYALFDLADLRVGRQTLIGREAERHGDYSRKVRDGEGV